ncbi:cytochrome c oxidase assembly factor 3 homolog, mitochondrial [Esox lucius]|uniref:Cytochrome c oxidase assembly factor 3 n=1 Tax=Esox lucius TaxID=8010 RepID=A0AAY5KSV0_ESOLU|nr:cytochrome c oxidase assembly factor 3 homolog, mitochondrial [Esox lucius]
MADRKPTADPEVPFAKRIDPKSEDLTRDELYFIRQVELAQWKKKSQKLRGRNIATGLAIGAIVMGIYGYTFYSVSQEKIMDELDDQAKVARMGASKTGAN